MRLLRVIGRVVRLVLSVWVGEGVLLIEWELLEAGSIGISLECVVDRIGLFFIGVVFFITACVIRFSEYYIESEQVLDRFVYLVILFVMRIGFLIFFPSLFGFMLG